MQFCYIFFRAETNAWFRVRPVLHALPDPTTGLRDKALAYPWKFSWAVAVGSAGFGLFQLPSKQNRFRYFVLTPSYISRISAPTHFSEMGVIRPNGGKATCFWGGSRRSTQHPAKDQLDGPSAKNCVAHQRACSSEGLSEDPDAGLLHTVKRNSMAVRAMSAPLTERQAEILAFVQSRQRTEGMAPTLEENCALYG